MSPQRFVERFVKWRGVSPQRFVERSSVSSSGGACLLSVSSRGVAFRQVEGRFVERSSVACREEGLCVERSSVSTRGGACACASGPPNIIIRRILRIIHKPIRITTLQPYF